MKKILIVLSVLIILAPACGFTPQTVVLKPEIQPAPESTVPGRIVYLTVVDERPNHAIETWASGTIIPGGMQLIESGDLTRTVRTAIANGLQQQGFVVTSRKTADEHELRVGIRNLNYFLSNDEPGHAYVSAECKLVAMCIKGHVRSYENHYCGEDMKSRFLMPFMPGKEANERHINNAISKAVHSLLQDSKLTHCLEQ